MTAHAQSIILALLWFGLGAVTALTCLLAYCVYRSGRHRCTCASGLCERHGIMHSEYNR